MPKILRLLHLHFRVQLRKCVNLLCCFARSVEDADIWAWLFNLGRKEVGKIFLLIGKLWKVIIKHCVGSLRWAHEVFDNLHIFRRAFFLWWLIPPTNPCISPSKYFWVNLCTVCFHQQPFPFHSWKFLSVQYVKCCQRIVIRISRPTRSLWSLW